MVECSCTFLLALISVSAVFSPGDATLSYSSKPILTYLVHYKLGQIKEKVHDLKYHLKAALHKPPPLEEHFHHYYVEPVPYGGVPLHTPSLLHGGKTGYSSFSLDSPLVHGKIHYDHYWDLPSDTPW